jgi:hypothetical protein
MNISSQPSSDRTRQDKTRQDKTIQDKTTYRRKLAAAVLCTLHSALYTLLLINGGRHTKIHTLSLYSLLLRVFVLLHDTWLARREREGHILW